MTLLPRDESLSVAERESIDAICVAFENEWLAGRRPAMEVFLRQGGGLLQPALFRELLLLELDYRRSVRDHVELSDYLARFDGLTDVVRDVFAAADSDVPRRFLPGNRIGRFRVLRTLGAGAFATVYLAWDSHLEREVAVKVPHAARLCDPQDRQRFVNEARAVARLRHPHIVTVYDVRELDGDTVFLVMQYVSGQSLRDVLDEETLPVTTVCRVTAGVADAVNAAHESGVIHRDLKPRNILMDDQNRPHVCDFGLALRERDQRDREGEYAGTLAYMAPEQLRGEAHQLDGRADVWALGVILYEMLTGRHPFQGRNRREMSDDILNRDPRPPRQFASHVSRHLERVCLRCLAKRPADRFSTAGDLAEQLRVQHRRRQWALPIWGLSVALLLVTLGALLGKMWLGSQRPLVSSPIRGTIRLMVWGANAPQRQGVGLIDPDALPLRSGDRVRLAVELNQAAYAYVVWVDCRGLPSPVYPWRRGDWNAVREQHVPQSYLALPDENNAGWRIHNPHDGMETLLLLCRSEPLPPEMSLFDMLKRVPLSSIPQDARAIWFQDGQPVRATPIAAAAPTGNRPRVEDDSAPVDPGGDRSPVLDQHVTIRDPTLIMHRQLAEILRPHFQLVRAVTFPVKSN